MYSFPFGLSIVSDLCKESTRSHVFSYPKTEAELAVETRYYNESYKKDGVERKNITSFDVQVAVHRDKFL